MEYEYELNESQSGLALYVQGFCRHYGKSLETINSMAGTLANKLQSMGVDVKMGKITVGMYGGKTKKRRMYVGYCAYGIENNIHEKILSNWKRGIDETIK